MLKKLIYCFLALFILAACNKLEHHLPPSGNGNQGDNQPENPAPESDEWKTELAAGMQKCGVDYIYDLSALPEMYITVPLEQWNALLAAYDLDMNTKKQVECDIRLVKGSETTEISRAGIRLKGNTSRRRPEISAGQHNADNTNWQHCHFQINFRKFVKDDAHKVHGAKKVVLKYFREDPMYCREVYSYDYFHRMNVWNASYASYCRLFLKVEGDSNETYYGVYAMIEPVDDDYLKVRKGEHLFGSDKGYLWKCRNGADLNSTDLSMGPDLDDGTEYIYELKTNTETFEDGKAQLLDFINNVRTLSGETFFKWIGSHCDIDQILRIYAVNVAIGMWDDYWNNRNNFYIYFNSKSATDYTFYMIPYDHDNTLGTSHYCGVQEDCARHDPFNWGDNNRSPLIYKILQKPEWRNLYKKYLLEAVGDRDGVSWKQSSMDCIRLWHSMIQQYVSNDTGEDCSIIDRPASWGNHHEYRLLEDTGNNYFKIKTESVRHACNQ